MLQDLGRLTGTVDISGAWIADHESVNHPGRYARFYSLTLDQDDQLLIDLSSEEDTYLFLLNGAGTGGSVVESDDDGGDGTGSRIVRDLISGNYTIEATTFGSGETGDFDLTISLPEAKAPPTSLVVEATANSGELALSWTAPPEFDSSTDRYEVQYSTGSEDPETGDVVYATWVPLLPHVAATEGYVLGSLSHAVHGVRVRAVYYDATNLLEGYSPFVYGEGTPLAVMVTGLGTLTRTTACPTVGTPASSLRTASATTTPGSTASPWAGPRGSGSTCPPARTPSCTCSRARAGTGASSRRTTTADWAPTPRSPGTWAPAPTPWKSPRSVHR